MKHGTKPDIMNMTCDELKLKLTHAQIPKYILVCYMNI